MHESTMMIRVIRAMMETQTKYRSKRESLKAVTLIVKPVMAVVKSHLSHLSLTPPKGAKEL